MRVTKVIREYVEREVAKKFEAAFKVAEEIGNPAVKEVREAIEAIADEANERAIALAKEKGVFDSNGYDESRIVLIAYHNYDANRHVTDTAVNKERGAKLAELRDKQKKAVEDILISLELGEATKNELRDLIEKVEV